MRVKAEVELGKGLVSTFLRGSSIEIWIGVFISIIAFYLVFGLSLSGSCLLFAIPLPEIRDEVPENFVKDRILTAFAIRLPPSPTKDDAASEVTGRRVSKFNPLSIEKAQFQFSPKLALPTT
jgi:hypothetical protein